MKNLGFFFLSFFILFLSCNSVENKKNPIDDKKPTQEIIPAISETKNQREILKDTTVQYILKSLFNNFNEKENYSLVEKKMIPDSLLSRFNLTEDEKIKAVFEKNIEIENGRNLSYFKIIPTENFECRICAPILAIAELNENNGTWTINNPRYFDIAGTYGIAPDIKKVKLGKEIWGLEAGLADLHMGIVWSANNYYTLDDLKNVILITTQIDNSGACDPEGKDKEIITCYENETTIKFVDINQPFYKIETHTTGTNWDYEQDVLLTLDQKKNYIFQNGKYRLEE